MLLMLLVEAGIISDILYTHIQVYHCCSECKIVNVNQLVPIAVKYM